ncbi:MAG: hypothetical protein VX262_00230, partial [Acidobacteriota bacterium]|nr:hypothetical protein [Acidobacteriota bacterium]
FPALVHLKGGTEYAIVVHSNSDEYKVYTAELGGALIGTDQKVSKQPYAGSFFKSQNASTWTESPFEDLMFRVNRATWVVGTTDANGVFVAAPNTSTLVVRAAQPLINTAIDRLVFYPHEVAFPNTTSTSYTLSLKPEDAGNTGSINSSAVAVTYTTSPQESYALNTRSLIQGYGTDIGGGLYFTQVYPSIANSEPSGAKRTPGATANTIDGVITLTTTSADVAPYVDLKKMNVLGIKHLINNLGLTANQFSVTNPSKGYPPYTKTGNVYTTIGSTVVNAANPDDAATYFTGSDPGANGSANTLVVGESVVIDGNMALTVESITSATQFIATSAAPRTTSNIPYAVYDHITLTVSNSASGNGATGYAVVNAASTTDVTGFIDRVELSANGSGYTGTPTVTLATYPLTGTVANDTSATALTGTGTFFEVDLEVGNVILMNGTVEATVNSITSNTALTVTSALSAAVGSSNTYALSGNTGAIVYHGEDYQSGGPALTRYFTKPITLATGFDARDLTVYFDAIRPSGSNIYVYYKILPGSADNARLDDQSWRLMVQETSDAQISNSQYRPFEFRTASGIAADSSSDTTDTFRMFAVKIVMTTKDTTYVPTIKNFRAIALDA